MVRLLKTVGFAVLAISLSAAGAGCTHMGASREYEVSVNSFARSNALEDRTYVVMPFDADVEPMDLEFQEYSAQVAKVLGERGFRRAPSIDDAEVVVLLAYGIGEPREHSYTYNLPVWGQTGVASTRTTTDATLFRNSAKLNSETSYTPQYGVTGFTNQTGSYTTFTRHALICAIDLAQLRNEQKFSEIWKTRIVSVGSSGDLRQVFPAMLAAARDLLATSTGRTVERTVSEDSPVVLWLRESTSPNAKKRRPGANHKP